MLNRLGRRRRGCHNAELRKVLASLDLLKLATSERLADHLLRGELSSLEESPTEPHPVTRTFPSPVLLRRRDESVARVVQITATVAEAQAEPMVIETPTAEIAWMLADTLTGSHTWFAIDGRIWQTPQLTTG